MREKTVLNNHFGFSLSTLNSWSTAKIRSVYASKMQSINAESREPRESAQFYNQTSCRVETRKAVSPSVKAVLSSHKADKKALRKPGKARFDAVSSMKGDKFGFTYTTVNGQKVYRVVGEKT
jgi:hypothetical protein